MGFIDRLFGREKRNIESPPDAVLYGNGTSLDFGRIFNNNTAMNISAVYRAVEIISDSIAMLPIQVKEKHGLEILKDHNLYTIFEDKNGLLNKYTFIKMLIQSVLLKGNGFALINRNLDGSVKSLRFLESCEVNILYNKPKNELYYSVPTITPKRIEPINMIHLIKNSFDGVIGVSVLTYAARSIKNANNTENSANNFFESGCNLSGILKVNGQLNPQQKQDIRNSWSKAYGTGGNGLAVLQGNMEYQPVQLSASDSQLLESRQFNVQDIARFFGISPVLLGDLSHTSYNTVEAIQQAFLLHTLQPYIVIVEEEFTKKLLKKQENDLIINLDETYLLKTDKAATASYFSSLVNNGIITRNEARTALGYGEVEGGDKLVIPFTNINDNTLSNDGREDL